MKVVVVTEHAEEQLRQNIKELMRIWGMNQTELAEKLGKTQSWVSRRLNEGGRANGGTRFQFNDLDDLACVFGLSPAELLRPGYGKWDRRGAHDRRTGHDRRGPSRGARPEPEDCD